MTANNAAARDRRAIVSWALYDFANSPFTTLVVTFVYSTYFTQAIAGDAIRGTVLWSRAVTISAIAVALASPILGALADRGGWRNADMPHWFADFTRTVMSRIGDRVWSAAPINEPWCVSYLSHFLGHHAPGLKDIRAAARAMHHINLAHGVAMSRLRAPVTKDRASRGALSMMGARWTYRV